MSVTVDNTLPTADIVSPTNGTHIAGLTNVAFTLGDDNLKNATLLLDGEILAPVTNSTSYLWNTTEIIDGQHILTLKAVDQAGNIKTSTVMVVTDNTQPTAHIISPTNDTVASGTIKLRLRHGIQIFSTHQ